MTVGNLGFPSQHLLIIVNGYLCLRILEINHQLDNIFVSWNFDQYLLANVILAIVIQEMVPDDLASLVLWLYEILLSDLSI